MTHDDASRSVSDLASLICHGAGQAIDVAISMGKRLPITILSDDLAKQTMTDKTFVYHIVSKYVKTRNDLTIKMGPFGGICKA
jgi:hypothetical protein